MTDDLPFQGNSANIKYRTATGSETKSEAGKSRSANPGKSAHTQRRAASTNTGGDKERGKRDKVTLKADSRRDEEVFKFHNH